MKKRALLVLAAIFTQLSQAQAEPVQFNMGQAGHMVGGRLQPKMMNAQTKKLVERYFDPTFLKSEEYKKIERFLNYDSQADFLYYVFNSGVQWIGITLSLCQEKTVRMNGTRLVCRPLKSRARCKPGTIKWFDHHIYCNPVESKKKASSSARKTHPYYNKTQG